MLSSNVQPRPGIRYSNMQPVTVSHQQLRHSQNTSTPSQATMPNIHVQGSWHNGRWTNPHACSQIEALPPDMAIIPTAGDARQRSSTVSYNPSMRHPVFFTERLRKPPFQLPNGAADLLAGRGGAAKRNPCAQGYVFEEGMSMGKRNGGTRL